MIINPSRFIEFIRRTRSSSALLTPLERSSIIVMHNLGLGPDLIAQMIERDVRAVHRWITHFNEYSNLDDEPRSGRPPVTQTDMDESIVALARQNPFLVPKDIKHALVLAVSARTIRRRLDEAGLFGRLARFDYPFTPQQIQDRLDFARTYENWTEDDWARVMFADEAYIYLGQHGQIWVQRPVDQEYILQFMAVAGPLNQKIGAWGAFSARGIAPIHLYTDTMNMQRLRTVFRTNLRPAALAQFPNQQWFLLHDNAPYHDGHLISEYIFDQGFELIHIPTYSPDLNPIENLWAILKREVEAMNPVNEEQLRQFVNEKWLTITPTMCRHLATSMPDRIKCVLACEGHKTGY
jgi:hypothetical protein